MAYPAPTMIDLHSHILPGLDDGAETVEGALEMACSAVADGIQAVAATPHVRSDYPTTPEQMEQGVESLREALREASIPLELLPGGEIALDVLPGLEDDELRRFGLGGNPAYLLLETPDFGWPLGLEETLFQLRLRGFTIVLAHPERNDEVQENPGRLERLVEVGTLVQVTAASVDGRLGPVAHKTALRLVELGLAHMLASDAHAPTRAAPRASICVQHATCLGDSTREEVRGGRPFRDLQKSHGVDALERQADDADGNLDEQIEDELRVPGNRNREPAEGRRPCGTLRGSGRDHWEPPFHRKDEKYRTPSRYRVGVARVRPVAARPSRATAVQTYHARVSLVVVPAPSRPSASVMNAVREVLRETRDDRLAEALLILAQRCEEADAARPSRRRKRTRPDRTDRSSRARIRVSAPYRLYPRSRSFR